jgi:uncharacterized protein YjbI with pentapeptide repeats
MKARTIVRAVPTAQQLVLLKAPEGKAGMVFDNLDLADFDFSGLKLESASFRNCNLFRGCFVDADLNGTTFYGSDLQRADFTGANLTNVDFSHADLRLSVFYGGCKLTGANFYKANIADAIFDSKEIKAAANFRRFREPISSLLAIVFWMKRLLMGNDNK